MLRLTPVLRATKPLMISAWEVAHEARRQSRSEGGNRLSALTFHSPLLRKTPSWSSPLPRNMLKLDRLFFDTVRI